MSFAKLVGLQKMKGWRLQEQMGEMDAPDEEFAAAFAKSMRCQGTRPLTVGGWQATMRKALGANVGKSESTVYNSLDVENVAEVLGKYEGLQLVPARDLGPVVFISGPLDTLTKIYKKAGALKTSEADVLQDGSLQLTWD